MSDYDVEVKVSVPNGVFKTLRQVADEERVSVGSVIREVLRTYVPPAAPVALVVGTRDEQIAAMHGQTMTDREIAVALGVSHSTVSLARKRLGLPAQGWARRAERLKREAS